ncbi:hypothetical protein D0Z07_8154 [Hyphodiscus hymeniophilus]|uniref:Uncharacterized protein n=1 Tax=Hyphodiscus hymeniophilus TaxID=353542 RepID=A0A9P6VED2_9HELO|nr:hypothetical protein D0Z07_8154 [Hyphodiscus hymeniophilus]
MLLKLFPFAILASTVLADGAAIIAAMYQISNDTVELQNQVGGWDGDILGVLPIVGISTKLLSAIDSGTHTAQTSANLTLAEVLSIVGPTTSLVSGVQSALSTVTDAREKFAKLLLAPVIKIDLELEKTATDRFSAAVVKKVPSAFQALAESLTAPVDVAFGFAIGNYTGLL